MLITMHGRSCMTIDPRIPTLPRRSGSGFTDLADVRAPSAKGR